MQMIKNFYKYDLGYALVFSVLFLVNLAWAAFSVTLMVTLGMVALYFLVPILIVGFIGMWTYMIKEFYKVYG